MGNRITSRPRGPGFLVALLAIWCLLVGTGFVFVFDYQNDTGSQAEIVSHWPASSALALDAERPTLVMLAHPHCPCTRATMGELARLMAQCQDLVRVHVLFYAPSDAEKDWERTDLWESAAVIPGVEVHLDTDGRKAQLFGGVTSGQVLLFDRDGTRTFAGGITASRGHSGDNVGRSTIAQLVRGGAAERPETPVFGCDLCPESEVCEE